MKKQTFSFFIQMQLVLFFILTIYLDNSLWAGVFDIKTYISAISDNTKQAKQDALSQGSLNSLKFVVSKITTKESMMKIDTLINETNAYKFEKGFSISEEEISKGKYSARITYYFDEIEIIKFMEANDIPYTKTKLGRYLVVPFFYTKEGFSDSKSSWETYWMTANNGDNGDFLSTFIYYKNNDKSFFTNKKLLNELKTNLNIDDVVILDLSLQGDDTYKLTMKKLISNKTTVIRSVTSVKEAVMLAYTEIEDDSKNEVLKSYLRENADSILTIPTNNFSQALRIQNILNDISSIAYSSIVEIGAGYIKVKVRHKSDLTVLKQELQTKCIALDLSSLFLNPTLCNE